MGGMEHVSMGSRFQTPTSRASTSKKIQHQETQLTQHSLRPSEPIVQENEQAQPPDDGLPRLLGLRMPTLPTSISTLQPLLTPEAIFLVMCNPSMNEL